MNVDFFVYIILIHVSCAFAAFAVFCAKPFVSIIRFPPDSFSLSTLSTFPRSIVCAGCVPEKILLIPVFLCYNASGNVGGCRTFRLLRLRKRSRFQWPILSYTVTVQSLQPVFSNTFIDEYMSDANGEFVKIYLYLLPYECKAGVFFHFFHRDKFEHTEKDVKRALAYWERMHLLQLEYDNDKNLTGIRMLDSSSRDAAPSDPGTSGTQTGAGAPAQNALLPLLLTETPAPAQTVPAKKSYSADDILNFSQNESVAELFFIAERYLGRTLSATDINTLLYFYDVLGFSTELIVYLIESCVSNNHTSIRYIEKVALGWADQHITTVEEAKQGSPVLGKNVLRRDERVRHY